MSVGNIQIVDYLNLVPPCEVLSHISVYIHHSLHHGTVRDTNPLVGLRNGRGNISFLSEDNYA